VIEYKTVEKEASCEQTIEKSRFIAHVKPVASKEEAEKFIDSIKKIYKDATHNVPAMVIGERMQIRWASDDGEPQGTSGAPMVHMMAGEGITNTVVVVTRYFGDIKLGTGGLVRAYTGVCRAGIAAAGICTVRERTFLKVQVDYASLGRIQNTSRNGCFDIDGIIYDDKVTVGILSDIDDAENVKSYINDLTAGAAQVLEEKNILVKA